MYLGRINVASMFAKDCDELIEYVRETLAAKDAAHRVQLLGDAVTRSELSQGAKDRLTAGFFAIRAFPSSDEWIDGVVEKLEAERDSNWT